MAPRPPVLKPPPSAPPTQVQPERPRLVAPAPKQPPTLPTIGWTRLKAMPPSMPSKSALRPNDIFRLVGPSVWIVYAAASEEELKARKEVAQGSAVAISSSELLSNCHIVSNKPLVLIAREKEVVQVTVTSSDIATDRCVLQVQQGQLQPVAGVRPFGTLEVGERLFTVGAPRGLENTLGEGIVSGLRRLEGVALIQTTAPISPGSSGGGLFDEYGNLVGITTLYLRESHALNFAIAASEYWR